MITLPTIPPPAPPAGSDPTALRNWYAAMQRSLQTCVDSIRSLNAELNRMRPSVGVSEDGSGDATDPSDPAYYTTLGQNVSEGSETADTTTWTFGDMDLSSHVKGCWFYAMTRVVYNNLGDKIIYGYIRKITIDTAGRIYAVGPETRVNIDTCIGI